MQLASIKSVRQITTHAVQRAVARIRATGRSLETCNHHVRSVRSFCRFLADVGALASPLRGLACYNARKDRRHVRRAVTRVEFERLLRSVERSGEDVRGMTPPARAMLYELAAATGFRASELRALTVGSLTRRGVQLDARHTKNGRDAAQPLPTETAHRLAIFLRGRRDTEPMFKMPQPSRLVHMLRRDLQRARIAYRDGGGRFFDFHAMRHTYITWLAATVENIKLVQELARHSSIALTIEYCHVGQSERRAAVRALPALRRSA